MDKFALTFKLADGVGWADAVVSLGNVTHRTAVSYLTRDPLGPFAQALIDFIWPEELTVFVVGKVDEGVSPQELVRQRAFTWEDEPGGWRWILKPQEGSAAIVRLEDLRSRQGEQQPLLQAECSLQELASVLVDCIEGLLLTHGVVGYHAKWHAGDLPLSQYLILKRWLQAPQNGPPDVESGTWREDLAMLGSLGP